MNWFRGDLVISHVDNEDDPKFFYGLTFQQAIAKVKEVCPEPEKVTWAMYYPYPTDLKAHLLED